METTFFNVVVDTAISSLNERFKTLGEVNEKFKVLLGFTDMSDKDIVDHCQTLSNTLTHEGHSDIVGREMAMELQSVPDLPSKRMTTMDFLTFLHEKKLTEVFPNLWVALRICATLPVTVSAAEQSFSKLKLIKTYFRSTMARQRLSGLAIISVNHALSRELS
ncbi:uncharacterized protein LOC121862522 [Homarus americanus]|uniref:uncharacterized protein LOC121862520 n=1 Tax=Homarus americanus TaxID=6706 RepID=UPI001C474960|nr:uncharacterized protein LOC121862520 [Homarus americanus]XP_042216762.1 uncharacterized protein LOC121862522 [Homarus americanus]